MNEVILSIIIPVYNVEEYLERCIMSILSQNVENYEIIIVDDESADATVEIVKKMQQRYSNIILLQQLHAGQAKGRNLGLKYASGEYITFVDGDDYWEPGYLKRMYDIMHREKCDLYVSSSYYLVSNDKKELVNWYRLDKEIRQGTVDILFEENKVIGSLWLMTCKKEIVEKNNISFNDYVCNEDFDFAINVIIHTKKVAIINFPYYNYVRDVAFSTYLNLNGDKVLSYMQVYKKWFDYFEGNLDQYTYAGNVLAGISQNYLWAFYQTGNLDVKDAKYEDVIDYLNNTQYILWPNEIKNKNMRKEVWRLRTKYKIAKIKRDIKKVLRNKK